MLKSQYLLDIKAYFESRRGALAYKGEFEFEEESDLLVTEELWEAVLWLKSDVYLVLTVWGDSRATFVVRENTKKRMHKLLLRVREFPLLAPPSAVFEAFKDAASRLYSLSTPPDTESDSAILNELRTRWLSLSDAELH
jgi:hypothetical protein